MVTFIDDFSRFKVICLLKCKSEVAERLRNFVKFVENQFGYKPKVIRSDRGGEYIGNTVRQYFESNGISIQLTAAYSPQQNDVAERKTEH